MRGQFNPPVSLFDGDVRPLFDDLLQRLLECADEEASKLLAAYRETFQVDPNDLENLKRLLGEAARRSMQRAFDVGSVGPIISKINGPLPRSTAELRRRLNDAGLRSAEEDILFVAAYGIRNGFKERDARRLPVKSVRFRFDVSRTEPRARLTELEAKLRKSANPYLMTRSAAPMFQREGLRVTRGVKAESGTFIDIDLTDVLVILAVCFVWLASLLAELFEELSRLLRGNPGQEEIDEAIEKIDDAIEEIDEEIGDLQEDIDELNEDISEENDPDDRREMEDERRAKREATGKLERARDELRRVRNELAQRP
jgi:hypothetical protein